MEPKARTVAIAGEDTEFGQNILAGAGVDPLGFWSPFSYAEMQILSQAINAVGRIDQGKIADYLHATSFQTVVGDVKFSAIGEWQKSRILFVQYQGIQGHDVDQFREAGKAVIIYPLELKSGKLIYPFSKANNA